jgi:hypothetical protein
VAELRLPNGYQLFGVVIGQGRYSKVSTMLKMVLFLNKAPPDNVSLSQPLEEQIMGSAPTKLPRRGSAEHMSDADRDKPNLSTQPFADYYSAPVTSGRCRRPGGPP